MPSILVKIHKHLSSKAFTTQISSNLKSIGVTSLHHQFTHKRHEMKVWLSPMLETFELVDEVLSLMLQESFFTIMKKNFPLALTWNNACKCIFLHFLIPFFQQCQHVFLVIAKSEVRDVLMEIKTGRKKSYVRVSLYLSL